MNSIKAIIISALVTVGCAGCTTDWVKVVQGDPIVHGGPVINDNVFLLRKGGKDDSPERHDPAVIPSACKPDPNDDNFADKLGAADIVKCTEAMKLLIDVRWARFEHEINAAISTSNFLLDTSVLGLSTSVPLVAPGTAKVLGAIAAGLTGSRKSFDEDVLYSYSMQTILQQMRTDRAQVASRIETRLANKINPYANMYEASNDLFDYARAGSWDEAMASLQTNVAAQTAACQARLRDQQNAAASSTTPNPTSTPSSTATATSTSTATDPCNMPAAASAAPANATLSFASGQTSVAAGDPTIAQAVKTFNDGVTAGTISKITVQGTADGTNDASNIGYADKRAAAVVAALKAAGIDATKISSVASAVNGARSAVIAFVK